ncbi:MAG: A/G-specific adenine glycosylase [Jatrophihabitantaceae bacterium]
MTTGTERAGSESLADDILEWFAKSARELPWRCSGTSPNADAWAVLVSEFMLQQTPVARVLPVYTAWLQRWPTPAGLAQDSSGEAVRMWGRLGYPRRALRLHACAGQILARFGGSVPTDVDDLLSLPGIGDYTARAIAAFAFGQRQPVVDTNVRRVIARAVGGQGHAGPPSTTRDLVAAEALLPIEPAQAARFSAALMELGALVCTAQTPNCVACPIYQRCAWQLAGSPPYHGPKPRPQRFTGSDRQARGLLLGAVRDSYAPVDRATLDLVWADAVQRDRALRALIVDGLIELLPNGRFALPT